MRSFTRGSYLFTFVATVLLIRDYSINPTPHPQPWFAFAMLVVVWAASFTVAFGAAKLVQRPGRLVFAVLSVLLSVFSFLTAFSVLYVDLSHRWSDSFHTDGPMTFVTAAYFAIVAFSTTGFGDIYPTNDIARAAVAVEIVFGMLYMVLVFGVVGTAIMQSRNADRDPE